MTQRISLSVGLAGVPLKGCVVWNEVEPLSYLHHFICFPFEDLGVGKDVYRVKLVVMCVVMSSGVSLSRNGA